MYQFKLLLIVIVYFLFLPEATAKKRCKPLLEKLHNIQAMQRSGYSSKQGLSLRGREDKARNNWWQCENGGRKAQKISKQKKKNKSGTKSSSYHTLSKSVTSRKIKSAISFNANNSMGIKSKYHGSKQKAWYRYYQQPEQCLSANILSVFVFCSENKKSQRENFEKQYKLPD